MTKTTFKSRGVTVEIQSETLGEGHKAKVLSLEFASASITVTDLVKAVMAAQSALILKASKAKRKAAAKAKKTKSRKGGKPTVIAQARAPRKRKALVQTEMFQAPPDDAITPENLEERFPPENYGFPPPSTANSCVMG